MLFTLDNFWAILKDLGGVEGSRSPGARCLHTLTLLLPLFLLLVRFTEAWDDFRSLTTYGAFYEVSATAAARLVRPKKYL